MGTHNETYTGVGMTVKEAESAASSEFYYENGHRCDIRKMTLLSQQKVPPKKRVERKQGNHTAISFEPDPTAPQAEWPVECQFDIEYHS